MNQMVAAELTKRQGSEERLARWLAVGVAAALITLAAGIDIQLRQAPDSSAATPSITQFDTATEDAEAPSVELTKPVYDRSDLLLAQG